jgi:hypothetical protein
MKTLKTIGLCLLAAFVWSIPLAWYFATMQPEPDCSAAYIATLTPAEESSLWPYCAAECNTDTECARFGGNGNPE